ncbi:MAG: 16S rRNA (guanine(527)-N(7))-methyltransferase RsmG [Alphaproteobacteria bacterium]|nr:16S rRNA (guanine(527)-N(7))-methyltransferase RsmG [Alphaproteobacteria bacterium]
MPPDAATTDGSGTVVPDGPDIVAGHVSRETLDRLERYAETLRLWQTRINLVGPATVPVLWQRHMLDSVQLWPNLIGCRRLCDLGSGAGFPGLVLAACGLSDVHLIDSDQRKATFLRDAARVMGLVVSVDARRAEAVPPLAADCVTARALAPLPDLLALVHRHLAPGGRAVLLKGERWADEVAAAQRHWRFTHTTRPSLVDPTGVVLVLESLSRV